MLVILTSNLKQSLHETKQQVLTCINISETKIKLIRKDINSLQEYYI